MQKKRKNKGKNKEYERKRSDKIEEETNKAKGDEKEDGDPYSSYAILPTKNFLSYSSK